MSFERTGIIPRTPVRRLAVCHNGWHQTSGLRAGHCETHSMRTSSLMLGETMHDWRCERAHRGEPELILLNLSPASGAALTGD